MGHITILGKRLFISSVLDSLLESAIARLKRFQKSYRQSFSLGFYMTCPAMETYNVPLVLGPIVVLPKRVAIGHVQTTLPAAWMFKAFGFTRFGHLGFEFWGSGSTGSFRFTS